MWTCERWPTLSGRCQVGGTVRLRSGGGGGPCSPGVSPHLLYSLPRVLPPVSPETSFPAFCSLTPDWLLES